MTISRPLIRYHGAKFKLAKWISSFFPEHKVYVEPFGGGAAVLLNKHRSRAEIYNDVWGDIVNVFRVMRDEQMSKQLARAIHLTPFAKDEFKQCTPELFEVTADPVERARMTIFRSFAGFGSAAANLKHNTGFRGKSLRPSATPAVDWANYPYYIGEFCERLRGVTIENLDYRKLIPKHDSKDTLLYVDPPYVHDTRSFRSNTIPYAHEMSDSDHEQLLQMLIDSSSMVVVSGYDHPLYNSMLASWRKEAKLHKIDTNTLRQECLWIKQ